MAAADVHYHNPASPWTACGAEIPHDPETCAEVPDQVTCTECREFIDAVNRIENETHDCATDGHDYTEINSLGRGLIGLYCEHCDTRWAVHQITNGSNR